MGQLLPMDLLVDVSTSYRIYNVRHEIKHEQFSAIGQTFIKSHDEFQS